jgi:hypothetical protein
VFTFSGAVRATADAAADPALAGAPGSGAATTVAE